MVKKGDGKEALINIGKVALTGSCILGLAGLA